jgi:hypothetical protein
MFSRIFRSIDLGFVITERARHAVMAARTAGMPVSVMYDGGLEVKADDIRPFFKEGQPTVADGEPIVIGRPGDNGVLEIFRCLYNATTDSIRPLDRHPHGRPESRRDDDLWLTPGDYEEAFFRASQQAQLKRKKARRRTQGNAQ